MGCSTLRRRTSPMPDEQRSNLSFWTESNKHGRVTERDLHLFRVYVRAVLSAGVVFCATGISLDDGIYLIPDRAVMNSLINAGLVELRSGIFVVNSPGWQAISQAG